jgi:hypothetical protein
MCVFEVVRGWVGRWVRYELLRTLNEYWYVVDMWWGMDGICQCAGVSQSWGGVFGSIYLLIGQLLPPNLGNGKLCGAGRTYIPRDRGGNV